MRRLVIPFFLVLAASPSAAAGTAYTCSNFVSDYVLVSGASADQKPNPSPGFTKAVAVVLGIFMGATKQMLSDDNESELVKFERAVVGECSANPKAAVEAIAVAASASLTPVKTAAVTPSTEYQAISLTDLKLDKATLRGKKVEVSGFLQTIGEISMVSDGMMDMSKLLVETKNLSRETRKFLLESCSSGCQVTIRGTVASVMLNDGIIADEVLQ